MQSFLAWGLAAPPVSLLLIALVRPGVFETNPRLFGRTLTILLSAEIGCAVAALWLTFVGGPVIAPPLARFGDVLSLRIDRLGGALLLLVSSIGAVVAAYSGPYLDGASGQTRFFRRLSFTLGSTLLFVSAGDGVLLVLSLVGAGLGMESLIGFYSERPAARLARRKQFLFGRIAEACLIIALALGCQATGSLDLATLISALKAHATLSTAAATIALLVCVAAMLKSAQLPTHGWLVEVMEAPTPVSAILHAGVINAGGFLVLRFSPVIADSPSALMLLTGVGGATALFGCLTMLPQTSVKVSLAYSTVAQMGFMMLECGLGVFSAALLHILAHGLYKAHAFLSSGSVIDIARASWSPDPRSPPRRGRLAIAATVAVLIVAGVGPLFGATLRDQPGLLALAAVATLGLVRLLATAMEGPLSIYVIGRTCLTALAVAAAFFGLQIGAQHAFGMLLPSPGPVGPASLAVMALLVAAFAALTVFQNALADTRKDQPLGGAAYALVSNGFYLNTIVNRWVLKAWPAGARSWMS